MAKARESSPTQNLQTKNSVVSLEIEFDSVREKLPAEYEKAIAGAEQALNSHLKKLNTLKGRLKKAQERLVKAREQQQIKLTAAVQTRFEKAQVAVVATRAEMAELRDEIVELRKDAGELKRRLRKFNFIEKEIRKAEKKAEKKTVTSRKYPNRKKSKTLAVSTDADGGQKSLAEKTGVSRSEHKKTVLVEQEAGVEV